MTSFLSTISFDKVASDHVQAVINLELASYPQDEAASPEKIHYRVEEAGNYFLVAKLDTQVVGFINGTCIQGKRITHSSMSTHDSAGRTLVIHSVVTHSSYRRKGLAAWMIENYLKYLRKENLVDDVLLLCKSKLMPLYLSAGFQFSRISDVVHGQVSLHCEHY